MMSQLFVAAVKTNERVQSSVNPSGNLCALQEAAGLDSSDASTHRHPPFTQFPGSLVVRIRRSHCRSPGSIPGQGITFTFPNVCGKLMFLKSLNITVYYFGNNKQYSLAYKIVIRVWKKGRDNRQRVVHLGQRGYALPGLPQTRGLQTLEDSREGTTGPVSPRAGVITGSWHTSTCRQMQTHFLIEVNNWK